MARKAARILKSVVLWPGSGSTKSFLKKTKGIKMAENGGKEMDPAENIEK